MGRLDLDGAVSTVVPLVLCPSCKLPLAVRLLGVHPPRRILICTFCKPWKRGVS